MSTKPKLRWKLKPAANGYGSYIPRGSILHDGEKTYVHISCCDRSGTEWYWVAGWDSDLPYMNTCYEPVGSVEEAKAQAMAYVKKHMAQSSESNHDAQKDA